jgi:hypothetical protein
MEDSYNIKSDVTEILRKSELGQYSSAYNGTILITWFAKEELYETKFG